MSNATASAPPDVLSIADAILEVLRHQRGSYRSAVQSHLDGIATLADVIGNATRIVTVSTDTEPRLVKPKTNPLSGRLSKTQTLNGPVGFSYQSSVNRRRTREQGEEAEYFEAIARDWVCYLDGSPLIMHNGYQQKKGEVTHDSPKRGTLYLPVCVESRGNARYFVDNAPVELDERVGHLDKTVRELIYWPPKPERGGRQDLDAKHVLYYINVLWHNVTGVKGLEKGLTIRFE